MRGGVGNCLGSAYARRQVGIGTYGRQDGGHGNVDAPGSPLIEARHMLSISSTYTRSSGENLAAPHWTIDLNLTASSGQHMLRICGK